MTSTSFTIGMAGETRNSSRVLRPPGGGHTDIFGGEAPEPTRGRRQGYAIPQSSIGQPDEPKPKANGAEPVQNGAVTPEQPAPVVEAAPEPKAAPAPEPIQVQVESKVQSPVKEAPAPAAPAPASGEAPKRVRVPPGGFSSGLW